MPDDRVRISVSMHYQSLDDQAIESVEFLEATEEGLGNEYNRCKWGQIPGSLSSHGSPLPRLMNM